MVKRRLQFDCEKAKIENNKCKTGSVTGCTLFRQLLYFRQKVTDASSGENKRRMAGVFLYLFTQTPDMNF